MPNKDCSFSARTSFVSVSNPRRLRLFSGIPAWIVLIKSSFGAWATRGLGIFLSGRGTGSMKAYGSLYLQNNIIKNG